MKSHNGHEDANEFEATHAEIIARTLRWADQAAARQDYDEALRWAETVRGLGNALPDDYETKRRRWRQALEQCARSPRPTELPRSRRSSSSDQRT
jgi:hypothetical protein